MNGKTTHGEPVLTSKPLNTQAVPMATARQSAHQIIDQLDNELRVLNKTIHSHPETAYEEVFAEQTISAFLETQGFAVRRGTYGLPTSFEADIGESGPLVIFCAEYDALPGIGHACGHNLIATSSIAAFIACARVVRELGIAGRVRILGTPAEEGGGGKSKLIDAGAFSDPDIAAAIMAHPLASHQCQQYYQGCTGIAGLKLIASHKLHIEFRGRTAHAAAVPWKGLNALDAAVAAYNNISMLRQQIQPDDRIHGVITNGGTVPNVIPEFTKMRYNVRSPTVQRADALLARVTDCFEAAAKATGCSVSYIHDPTYMDLRVNDTLCKEYVSEMAFLGEDVIQEEPTHTTASTDMGNVSYTVPSFHGAFPVPSTSQEVTVHHPSFTAAAGTDEAHKSALTASKGMAMLGVRVLMSSDIREKARGDFRATL